MLEGEDVVDAVAGHGDRVAVGAQGIDHVLLLIRIHPAEDTCGFDLCHGVGGACVHRMVRARHTRAGGDRPHRFRVVP